jgi:hypothetical protein
MEFCDDDLKQITINVCQSMLGLELASTPGDDGSADQLVAAVEIRGTRVTVVEVFAHPNLMAAIAEAMFCSDRGSLSEDEIRDAFCEIANMIGGNIKGSFGEEADLSLPMFGAAHGRLKNRPEGSLSTTFDCCGYSLSIVVREISMNCRVPETIRKL